MEHRQIQCRPAHDRPFPRSLTTSSQALTIVGTARRPPNRPHAVLMGRAETAGRSERDMVRQESLGNFRTAGRGLLAAAALLLAALPAAADDAVRVRQTDDYVQIDTDLLQARVAKRGYVSGI